MRFIKFIDSKMPVQILLYGAVSTLVLMVCNCVKTGYQLPIFYVYTPFFIAVAIGAYNIIKAAVELVSKKLSKSFPNTFVQCESLEIFVSADISIVLIIGFLNLINVLDVNWRYVFFLVAYAVGLLIGTLVFCIIGKTQNGLVTNTKPTQKDINS